jgi:hypothetical protein
MPRYASFLDDARIDQIYAPVFEKILNERISTNPVAGD